MRTLLSLAVLFLAGSHAEPAPPSTAPATVGVSCCATHSRVQGRQDRRGVTLRSNAIRREDESAMLDKRDNTMPELESLGSGQNWVGDVWIPPGGKLYTVIEIQKTFERRRVIILGDSLARRLTASIALILNDEGNKDLLDSEIDEGTRLLRGGHNHYNWPIPSGSSRLDYQWTPRARDVASYVRQTNLSDYTDILVFIGVHDAEKPSSVRFEDDIKSAMNALQASAASVVWLTAPNMDNPHDPNQTTVVNARLRDFNSVVLRAGAPNVCVINVAATLAKKSVGKERLKGDTPEHFGNIARMVEIQTITHQFSQIAFHHSKSLPAWLDTRLRPERSAVL